MNKKFVYQVGNNKKVNRIYCLKWLTDNSPHCAKDVI